jgi:tRNA-specific 2-thiouridylase
MRVLVAMSGGVDSSVAAGLLRREGHEVVGATLKLWGGIGDSGCCSLADVTDARRVADRLGIEHHVFNFTDAFDEHVVEPYVAAHARAETPNPCVECNRHVKFGTLLARARRLGFDAVATGHHARIVRDRGQAKLLRGADPSKDQSYVLSVLGQNELAETLLPIGEMTKDEVRSLAHDLGLGVADKPDSQDVCFISSHTAGASRGRFLAERIALHQGVVRDGEGHTLGTVDAIELVTIGQRRHVGNVATNERRYVTAVDIEARTVTIGSREELLVTETPLRSRTFVHGAIPDGAPVEVQTSAHGDTRPALSSASGVTYLEPARRVAPGQIVALYRGDEVIGSGIAS